MWEQEEFSAHVGSDYILVSLDFPNGEEAKAKVPNPARNEELSAKYGIQGFPTVLLMTPEGEVFGRSGYTGASPADYLADVKKQRVEGKKALAEVKVLKTEFDQAEDKMAVVKKAITSLEELGDGVGGDVLANILRKGFEVDPEDKAGLKMAALKALFSSGQAGDAELAMATEADPKNEHGLMEQVVASALNSLQSLEDLEGFITKCDALAATGKVHDSETVGFLWVNAAYFCKEYLERPEDAKTWAKRAKGIEGLGEQEMEVINQILGETDAV